MSFFNGCTEQAKTGSGCIYSVFVRYAVTVLTRKPGQKTLDVCLRRHDAVISKRAKGSESIEI